MSSAYSKFKSPGSRTKKLSTPKLMNDQEKLFNKVQGYYKSNGGKKEFPEVLKKPEFEQLLRRIGEGRYPYDEVLQMLQYANSKDFFIEELTDLFGVGGRPYIIDAEYICFADGFYRDEIFTVLPTDNTGVIYVRMNNGHGLRYSNSKHLIYTKLKSRRPIPADMRKWPDSFRKQYISRQIEGTQHGPVYKTGVITGRGQVNDDLVQLRMANIRPSRKQLKIEEGKSGKLQLDTSYSTNH